VAEVTEAPARPVTARRSRLSIVVRVAVAVAALCFVGYAVPLRDRCGPDGCVPGLLTTLRTASVPALLALFALYLAGTLVWAARWRALLGLAEVRLSLAEVWRVTLEAQAGGILLPGGVGGDALRVAYVKSRAPEAMVSKVIASTLADRVVGLSTLAAVASAAAVGFGAKGLGPYLPVLVAIPVASVVGLLVLRHPRLAQAEFMARVPGARFLKPLLEYAVARGGPPALLRGVLASLVVSAVQLAVVRGILAAIGAQPDHEADVYIGTTLAMIVGALPALPGGWGTADAAYVFFLGSAGVPAPAAVATCLIYRVFWYATGLCGAVAAVSRAR
jgi:uncharacterized membrane protein YbhN (UPF0104 family)